MNWKLIVFGALTLFVTLQIASFGTGVVIHEGVLADDYRATHGHWRPELEQDPPDMMALMPMWLTNTFISCFVFAAVFGCTRSSLTGSPTMKGVQFGWIAATFYGLTCLGLFGVFNLPGTIWIWWTVDGFVLWTLGGAAMGWVVGRFVPEST